MFGNFFSVVFHLKLEDFGVKVNEFYFLMQYRFLVDDIWQVDKEQQCFHDTYGMINNMIFVDISEPVILSCLLKLSHILHLLWTTKHMHLHTRTHSQDLYLWLTYQCRSSLLNITCLGIEPIRARLQLLWLRNLVCTYFLLRLMFCVIICHCFYHPPRHMIWCQILSRLESYYHSHKLIFFLSNLSADD